MGRCSQIFGHICDIFRAFRQIRGVTYNFVFIYHVPLFFFLSGCMSNLDNEKNILRFALKRLKSIMLPFWIFSLLSVVCTVLGRESDTAQIKDMLLAIAKGNIRNTFVAGSLWFLSCLFVMEIIFKIIKYAKFGILIFAISTAIYIACVHFLPLPFLFPRWMYNLDSALYYIIYYAVGYIVFPLIKKLFELDSLQKRIVFAVTGVASFVYSALCFFGKPNVFSFLSAIPVLRMFELPVTALCIIWFNLIVAKLLENVALFNEIGRNTLYLCCNEYIVSGLIINLLAMVGLQRTVENPLQAYLLTALMLFSCTKVLIPAEKALSKSIINAFFGNKNKNTEQTE